MRRRALAAFALLLCVCAAGCGAIKAVIETEEALESRGFRDASVSWESIDGVERVLVSWRASAQSQERLTEESLSAAGVIWRHAPVRFDEVITDPSVEFLVDRVQTSRIFAHAQLEASFGPRPRGLDRDPADLLNVRGIAIGIGVAFFAFLGLAALIIVLVMRSRRGGPPSPPVAWPAPAGWPPPPPPPPGWPPPPPQGGDPWQAPPGYR